MITILRTDDGCKNDICFEARDKDEILGKIVSIIKNDALTVEILGGEAFIFDGLLRAALNCAEKEGAENAFFKCGYERELENLGFINGMVIKSFFENKNCKNSL